MVLKTFSFEICGDGGVFGWTDVDENVEYDRLGVLVDFSGASDVTGDLLEENNERTLKTNRQYNIKYATKSIFLSKNEIL